MSRTLLFASVLTAFATTAFAGGLQVVVKDAAGAVVPGAVVSFVPNAGVALKPADIKGPFVMSQQNVAFNPYVLVVPKGASVAFPNMDRVNHHVYSFSPVQKFQLPLYGKGQSRSMTFTTAGSVALGCNIHDKMQAYIRVVDTPFYAKTDAKGVAMLAKLPDTEGKLSIWHPWMSTPGQEIAQSVTVKATNAPVNISVRLRPRGAQ